MSPEERLRQMPVSCRATYKKAMKGRSMKAGITAFCTECVGYVRKEVEVCTDTGCPLYPYRPFQTIPWKARRVKASTGAHLHRQKMPKESTLKGKSGN